MSLLIIVFSILGIAQSAFAQQFEPFARWVSQNRGKLTPAQNANFIFKGEIPHLSPNQLKEMYANGVGPTASQLRGWYLRGEGPQTALKRLDDVMNFEKNLAHKLGLEQGVLTHQALELPKMTFGFLAANGAVNFMTMWESSGGNPTKFEDQLIAQKDPFTHISFYSFMLANGIWFDYRSKNMDEATRHAQFRRLMYEGLAWGSFVSTVVSDIGGVMKTCANDTDPASREERRQACKEAFSRMMSNGRAQQYLAQIFTLLAVQAATDFIHLRGAQTVSYTNKQLFKLLLKGGEKNKFLATGVQLAFTYTPGGLVINSAKILGLLTNLTMFVAVDHAINTPVNRLFTNILRPPFFAVANRDSLNCYIYWGDKYKWNSKEIAANPSECDRFEEFRKLYNPINLLNLPEEKIELDKSMPSVRFEEILMQEIDSYSTTMQDWRANINSDVEMSLNNWLKMTNRFLNQVSVAEKYYKKFVGDMTTALTNRFNQTRPKEDIRWHLPADIFEKIDDHPYQPLPLFGINFELENDKANSGNSTDKNKITKANAMLLQPFKTTKDQSEFLKKWVTNFEKTRFEELDALRMTQADSEAISEFFKKLKTGTVTEQAKALQKFEDYFNSSAIQNQAPEFRNFVYKVNSEIGYWNPKMLPGEGFNAAFESAYKTDLGQADFDLSETTMPILQKGLIAANVKFNDYQLGRLRQYAEHFIKIKLPRLQETSLSSAEYAIIQSALFGMRSRDANIQKTAVLSLYNVTKDMSTRSPLFKKSIEKISVDTDLYELFKIFTSYDMDGGKLFRRRSLTSPGEYLMYYMLCGDSYGYLTTYSGNFWMPDFRPPRAIEANSSPFELCKDSVSTGWTSLYTMKLTGREDGKTYTGVVDYISRHYNRQLFGDPTNLGKGNKFSQWFKPSVIPTVQKSMNMWDKQYQEIIRTFEGNLKHQVTEVQFQYINEMGFLDEATEVIHNTSAFKRLLDSARFPVAEKLLGSDWYNSFKHERDFYLALIDKSRGYELFRPANLPKTASWSIFDNLAKPDPNIRLAQDLEDVKGKVDELLNYTVRPPKDIVYEDYLKLKQVFLESLKKILIQTMQNRLFDNFTVANSPQGLDIGFLAERMVSEAKSHAETVQNIRKQLINFSFPKSVNNLQLELFDDKNLRIELLADKNLVQVRQYFNQSFIRQLHIIATEVLNYKNVSELIVELAKSAGKMSERQILVKKMSEGFKKFETLNNRKEIGAAINFFVNLDPNQFVTAVGLGSAYEKLDFEKVVEANGLINMSAPTRDRLVSKGVMSLVNLESQINRAVKMKVLMVQGLSFSDKDLNGKSLNGGCKNKDIKGQCRD